MCLTIHPLNSIPLLCRGTGHRRLEPTNELLLIITTCRHELHQGIMGYNFGMSNATVQRIFCDVISLATLFNEIDLKPPSVFLLKKMPNIVVETGHCLTLS